MSHHPVTRITSFLILAVFLAQGNTFILLLSLALIITLYIKAPPADISKTFQSVLRMKWFFLSIFLVYLLIDQTDASLVIRIFEGLKRVFILITLILMVNWLIEKTPRDEIISALIYLLFPLKLVGLPTEKMAMRIELIFRYIDDSTSFVTEKKQQINSELKSLTKIGQFISWLFSEIVEQADKRALDKVEIKLISNVSAVNWLLPLCLFSLLFLIEIFL